MKLSAKNVILIFVMCAVFGVCCGGVFQIIVGGGELELFSSAEREEDAPRGEEPEQQEDGNDGEELPGRQIRSGKNRTPNIVTNKSKECSAPGCGRSVFVTYRGRELCVKCYADEKNADLAAEREAQSAAS